MCDFDGPYRMAAANILAGKLEQEIKTDAFNPVSMIVEGNNAPLNAPSSPKPLWEIRHCSDVMTSSEDAAKLAKNTNARIVIYGGVNSIDDWYELQVSVVRNASWRYEALSHLTDEHDTWRSNPAQASEFVNSVLSDMTTEPLIYFYMVAASEYIELNRHLSAIQLLEIAEERALRIKDVHALSRIYYGLGILYNFGLTPTWQQYSTVGGRFVPTWNNSEKSISFLDKLWKLTLHFG